MKIKSHTGEMVEARVGMVCSVAFVLDDMVGRIKHIHDGGIITFAFDYTEASKHKDLCTMLHCPFQAGDDYEWHEPYQNKWHKGIIKDEDILTHILNTPWIDYRHANPNLRDAPEYKA